MQSTGSVEDEMSKEQMNMRVTRFFLIACLVAAAMAVGASPAMAAFGVSSVSVRFENEDGTPATQAGSHPYAMTTKVAFNTTMDPHLGVIPDGNIRDLTVEQPVGFVGDPTATPQCSNADFVNVVPGTTLPSCSNSTVVGIAKLELLTAGNFDYAPVYILEPPPGVPAELGFIALGVPVTIDVGVRSGGDYGLTASLKNVSEAVAFYSSELTLWGNPADPTHNAKRGSCVGIGGGSSGSCPTNAPPKPFLTLPRSCDGPLITTFSADSWQESGLSSEATAESNAITGCNKLGFGPSISAQPTTDQAETATGLNFGLEVEDEGLTSTTGIARSDLRKAVVALPQGMTVNPSVAEGLGACSLAGYAAETVDSAPGEGCPNDSKIGSIQIDTPLLEEPIPGSLFVAEQGNNPFNSLLALYVVAKNPKLGIMVKAAGKVEPNEATGRLVTTFENLPQLPFSRFALHFREGQRAPLVTPPSCGEFTTTAQMTPWSNASVPASANSTFKITHGNGGSACPSGGLPPFHPGLLAGTINNAAGSYSPFDLRLTRSDSEQEFTHFSIKLPPGVVGKLAGIPFCPNAAIAAAKARTGPHGGQEELESPSCPAASYVGRTLVGAGVGSSLTYVPGKVYLAGPYHGAPISIVDITAAKVGPFDLGTVVVREALKVNPETAEVFVDATGSDPIPHIIQGIVVHARDIRVYVDRPEFVLNPTSCEPTSTASTVLGSGLNFASEADDNPFVSTSPFQAADCAALDFGPTLKLKLKGKTHRGANPALRAILTTHPNEANIASTVVALPASEYLENAHIGTSCTRVQFNEGNGNGEKCPPDSIYGHAKAWTPILSEPLEGPVYMRSNGGERKLPDLVAALHNEEINIDLVGYIDSLEYKTPRGETVSGIRTTFASVPDAPVTKFILDMAGGRKSLLVNSTDVCAGRHLAKVQMDGQNGKRQNTKVALKAECPKARKHKGKGKHPRRAAHRRHRAG